MSRFRSATPLLVLSLFGSALWAHDGNPPYVGHGTATIDGTLGIAEWSGAATRSLALNLPQGGTTSGTLYIMNDASNLYLGVYLSGWDNGKSADVAFDFDDDHDGLCETGEDSLLLGNSGLDDEVAAGGSPAGQYCASFSFDTDKAGTADGSGVKTGSASYTVFEISHPLASADTSNDFHLAIGDTIGFTLEITLCDGSCLTSYPTAISFAYAPEIQITGFIFGDTFESGNTSAWSSVVP